MNRLIWLSLLGIGWSLVVAGLAGCEEDEVSTRQAAKALPVGSLELRILASRTPDNSNNFDNLVNDVVEKGPEGTSRDDFAWYEVADDRVTLDANEVVLARWQGRRFILASTAAEQVLDRRTNWVVKNFELVRHDPPYGHQLLFELDKAGGEQLEKLTAANLERSLGIFLFGKLESHAVIKDVIADRISLNGVAEHMERLHGKLQKTVQTP